MTYTLISGQTGVIRDADGAAIPPDPQNTDWQNYQMWLAAGNTPNPAPVQPTIWTIQMWQAQYVMSQTPYDPSKAQPAHQAAVAGKTNVLDAFTALLPTLGNPLVSFYWAQATTLTSNDAVLLALAADLGLTSDDVVAMFRTAAAVTV
jgi:hypothetical protein